MTPQELKNSILQLAIQGKLVEQREEEGNAEDLYAQIQAEKQRLIAEKKIKKQKPLPAITDEEKPFEIPESWKWVRLGEMASLVTKGTTPRGGNVSYLEKGIGFLRAENVGGFDKLDKTNLKYIDESTHIGYLKRSIIQENDILITIAGTLGRTAIVRKEDLPLNANQAISIVRVVNNQEIELLYLVYALNAGSIQKYLTGKRKITAIPNLTLEIIENCILPLPPFAEQQRIVAKIEELLPHIDRYEQAWSKLEQFNARFPEDMKKSLLQYAIQGKLVEQRPEEGNAEDLYAQIQTEKQRLIAEKKIKKQKLLPEITDEEKPFDIPATWKWVRFSDLMNAMSTGPFGSMLHKSDYVTDGIPLVNPSNIINGKIIPSEKMRVSEDTAKRLDSYRLYTGMIVIGRRGEMGRCAVVGENENGWLCGTGSFFLMPSSSLRVDYISYLFTTYYVKTYLGGASVGTTMKNLNHKILSKMPVPLPPLAEQKRIVEKLEQLLPLCKQLR